MAKLTKLEKDIAYVSALSDYPNSNDGMTSSQLKETFDKSSNDIKNFINNVLTEEIDLTFATRQELQETQMGQIVDGAVTLDKLAEDVQERINKVDTVEEKANDASYKVDNIFQYNIPTVEQLKVGEHLVSTTSNVFGQLDDLGNLQGVLTGTAVGNQDNEKIDFELDLGYGAITGITYNNTLITTSEDVLPKFNEILILTSKDTYYSYNVSLVNSAGTSGTAVKEAAKFIWDLKKPRTVALVSNWSGNTNNYMDFYGSNDKSEWTKINSSNIDSGATTSTSSIEYRYYKVSLNGRTGYGFQIFYLYLANVADSYIVDDNTNLFTLPYNLENLNVNQRVLIQAPSETNMASVIENKLNNIPIETLLSPNQKYELVYDGEKFVGNNGVLYDITLEEAVSQIDLPNLLDKLQVGKMYYMYIAGNSSASGSVKLGGCIMADIKDAQPTTSSIFPQYNAPRQSVFCIRKTEGRTLIMSDYGTTGGEITNDTQKITFISTTSGATLNIGTRIIIKEVC